jgi:hypothetical protein
MPRILTLVCSGFVVMAVLAAAACGGGTTDSVFGIAGCGDNLPATGGTGSAVSHGQPQRNDGPVEVAQDGQGFVARQVVTISNDFGGANSADVTFSTVNGNVAACPGGQGGYGVRVSLQARGMSAQEAQAQLATMSVQNTDALAGVTLHVTTQVTFGQPVQIGGVTSTGQRTASILSALPAAPSYVFRHSTTNGNVEAPGFSGTSAQLDATNGSVALNGRWDQASASVTDGFVSVNGDFASLSASSTNGDVHAGMQTRRSSSASVSSTNGGVEVALARSGSPAFDLTADTTNGMTSINVAGTAPVGSQTAHSKHRQSPDYSTNSVKISVDASSTNGDVGIHD